MNEKVPSSGAEPRGFGARFRSSVLGRFASHAAAPEASQAPQAPQVEQQIAPAFAAMTENGLESRPPQYGGQNQGNAIKVAPAGAVFGTPGFGAPETSQGGAGIASTTESLQPQPPQPSENVSTEDPAPAGEISMQRGVLGYHETPASTSTSPAGSDITLKNGVIGYHPEAPVAPPSENPVVGGVFEGQAPQAPQVQQPQEHNILPPGGVVS